MLKNLTNKGFIHFISVTTLGFFIGQALALSILLNLQPTYSPEELYKVKISSVVRIYALNTPLVSEGVASGTGFFISKDGLVVTAAHVIYDDNGHPNSRNELVENVCNFIFIKTSDNKYYTVIPIKIDLQHDIALLKVSRPLLIKDRDKGIKNIKFIQGKKIKKEFNYLELIEIDKPIAGEPVTTIGFSGLYSTFISTGIVSSPKSQTSAQEDEDTTFKDLVVTSMLLFPGNSGGPVFNKYGKVVGVATLGSNKSISMYQRSAYIKRLLGNKTKDLVAYKRDCYDKEYDN